MSGNLVQRAQERKSKIEKERAVLQNKISTLDDELEHLNYFFESLAPHATGGNESETTITIVKGAVQILNREQEYLSARHITDFLLELGYETEAKNPLESVRASISGEARKTSPRLIRRDKDPMWGGMKGGPWTVYYGLPEWRGVSSIGVRGHSLSEIGNGLELEK